jgi:hypothetical protein
MVADGGRHTSASDMVSDVATVAIGSACGGGGMGRVMTPSY